MFRVQTGARFPFLLSWPRAGLFWLRALLAALVVLLPMGCCTTRISSTGYQRHCVWSNRGASPPAPPPTGSGSPPPEGVEILNLVWLPEQGAGL
jgi:hypothetical protein